MTYPLSNEVNVGDATEASQYNNLRADALYLGGDPAGSGTLRDLMLQQMGELTLVRLSKTTIELTASANEPAAVMIEGNICAITSSASILVTSYDCPAAGRYYVYATPSAGGAFTLGAGAAAPSGSRIIGTFLWSGSGIIPNTVQDIRKYRMSQGIRDLKRASGRLTLAAGTPVPDSDITVANTVYFTPYNGNEIGLLIGTEWELFEYSELSASLTGLQHEIPYDVFISADEDGLKLSLNAWGSTSARLTGIGYTDGVPVSAADPGLRYLGTIALNDQGFCEDSQKARLIWNKNNQVPRALMATAPDTAQGSNYQNAWTPYFGADAPEVRILVPMPETDLDLFGIGISSLITDTDAGYSRGILIGIGLDMTMSSPYTGNKSSVPVYCASYGNSPVTVALKNSSPAFRGHHRYTLAFFTNYSYVPAGKVFQNLAGEHPGLYGALMG